MTDVDRFEQSLKAVFVIFTDLSFHGRTTICLNAEERMKQNHQKRSHGKNAANRRKNNVRRSQKNGKHAHGTRRPYAHRRAHTMDTPPAHTAEELLYGTFGATAHGYGFFCPDEKEPTADPAPSDTNRSDNNKQGA